MQLLTLMPYVRLQDFIWIDFYDVNMTTRHTKQCGFCAYYIWNLWVFKLLSVPRSTQTYWPRTPATTPQDTPKTSPQTPSETPPRYLTRHPQWRLWNLIYSNHAIPLEIQACAHLKLEKYTGAQSMMARYWRDLETFQIGDSSGQSFPPSVCPPNQPQFASLCQN